MKEKYHKLELPAPADKYGWRGVFKDHALWIGALVCWRIGAAFASIGYKLEDRIDNHRSHLDMLRELSDD